MEVALIGHFVVPRQIRLPRLGDHISALHGLGRIAATHSAGVNSGINLGGFNDGLHDNTVL